MNPLNQVNIEEKSTEYSVKLSYHSDLKCENYDVEIMATEEAGGTISLYPVYEKSSSKYPFLDFPKDADAFNFVHSDPDRIIAIAQTMMSFAQMVKNNSKNDIDTTNNE